MYSNLKNSDTERLVFLEDTIQQIYDTMKHMGCNISDKDSMPIEQLVSRELNKFKFKISDEIYSIGTIVVCRNNIDIKGKIIESNYASNILRQESKRYYTIQWNCSSYLSLAFHDDIIPLKML